MPSLALPVTPCFVAEFSICNHDFFPWGYNVAAVDELRNAVCPPLLGENGSTGVSNLFAPCFGASVSETDCLYIYIYLLKILIHV